MIDDDGVFRRSPPRRPPRPTTKPSGTPRRRPPAPDPSSLSNMIATARPTGRLPALTPSTTESSARGKRYADKWRRMVGGAPTRTDDGSPTFEPSRYVGSDEEEDS